jgi:SAM-dependent methyltransferase
MAERSGRVVAAEMMDRPGQDPAELTRSLHDLRSVNRWLGGGRAVLRRLLPMMRRLAVRGEVSVLDVGTGSADLPLLLVARARHEGIAVRVVATDLHETTVEVAADAASREPAVRVVRADALDLPFRTHAFDLAMCCTTLHHFEEADAVRVLGEMERVARWGILVSDLRRTRGAMLGVRALAATVWRRHPITRHDAPVSVAAAFSPAELRSLAAAAGVRDATVRAEPLFRLSLLADRTSGLER